MGLSFTILTSSDPYVARRRKQMFAFYGFSIITLIGARFAIKGTRARIYIPTLYQQNHRPPNFNFHKDALLAAGVGTLLAGTTFATAVSGLVWSWDVKSPEDFADKMKRKMGGFEKDEERRRIGVDDETKELENAIEGFLGGNLDLDKNSK